MSPLERAEIRSALNGAVLNVAIHAASLHMNRRLIMRLDHRGRYAIRYAGADKPLISTSSIERAAKFLDQLGMPK